LFNFSFGALQRSFQFLLLFLCHWKIFKTCTTELNQAFKKNNLLAEVISMQ
jgi:hypothetical protein